MSDAPELLPCPFCGDEADVSHDHTVEENHAYGCRKCGVWFDTFNSDDAISAWNRRAALSDHPAVKALVAEAEARGMERAAVIAERHLSKVQINEALWHEGQDWAAESIALAIRAEAAAIRGETTCPT